MLKRNHILAWFQQVLLKSPFGVVSCQGAICFQCSYWQHHEQDL